MVSLSKTLSAAATTRVRSAKKLTKHERKLESALKEAERLRLKIWEDGVTAKANFNSAQRQFGECQQALEEERAQTSDADLSTVLQEKAEACRRAQATLAGCRSAVQTLNPEEVRLRLQNTEEAWERTQSDIERLKSQARDLEVELRTMGQTGLGEELQEKEGELTRARDDAARIEREAKATHLLLETLRAAERQAKENFLGPVRERIKPYLKLLFPNEEVLLADDHVSISHLRRNGVDEPFEQLAVLTRLAFAELLRDKGRPAAVMLDDALALMTRWRTPMTNGLTACNWCCARQPTRFR